VIGWDRLSTVDGFVDTKELFFFCVCERARSHFWFVFDCSLWRYSFFSLRVFVLRVAFRFEPAPVRLICDPVPFRWIRDCFLELIAPKSSVLVLAFFGFLPLNSGLLVSWMFSLSSFLPYAWRFQPFSTLRKIHSSTVEDLPRSL